MNIALLTAAGHSIRMGQDIPKQFIHVENKPLIIYTMEAFERHPAINAIMVVALPAWEEVIRAYAAQFGITKLRWIVTGGETGQQSIANGLRDFTRTMRTVRSSRYCGQNVLQNRGFRPVGGPVDSFVYYLFRHGLFLPLFIIAKIRTVCMFYAQ